MKAVVLATCKAHSPMFCGPLTLTPCGCCYYPHFTDEETGPRDVDLLKLTQVRLRSRIRPWREQKSPPCQWGLLSNPELIFNYPFLRLV